MNETVLVDGRDVVYRHHAGDGPTLVLIHGAGANHHAFDDLTVCLGGREMIVPSLPGRCGSLGEPKKSAAELASWLRKLLRTIGVGRALILGHSLGGAVALEYALGQGVDGADVPELAGLILVSTGARLRVSPAILDAVRAAAQANMPCELPQEAWSREFDPAVVAHFEAGRARTPSSVALIDWMAADAFDRMQDLGRIDCPTLIVAGTTDRLTPENYAQYLHANIRGAKLDALYGASHMCIAERPAEVARHVLDFSAG